MNDGELVKTRFYELCKTVNTMVEAIEAHGGNSHTPYLDKRFRKMYEWELHTLKVNHRLYYLMTGINLAFSA